MSRRPVNRSSTLVSFFLRLSPAARSALEAASSFEASCSFTRSTAFFASRKRLTASVATSKRWPARNMALSLARRSASLMVKRGSGVTTTLALAVLPCHVTRTVYVPGKASGPEGTSSGGGCSCSSLRGVRNPLRGRLHAARVEPGVRGAFERPDHGVTGEHVNGDLGRVAAVLDQVAQQRPVRPVLAQEHGVAREPM